VFINSSLITFLVIIGINLFCFVGHPNQVFADDSSSNTFQQSLDSSTEDEGLKDLRSAGTFTIYLLKVCGALSLVLFLMYMLILFIKKLGIVNTGTQTQLINILDTRMIGPKKYITVLNIAEQFFAVGVTEQHVELIAKLDDNEQLRNLIPADGENLSENKHFSSVLKNALNSIKSK
jgi:flagellar biogenesis protein FliO